MAQTSYPSDVTDAQWAIIEPLLPPPKPGGRPRTADLRGVVNGIFYKVFSGCSWRMLPREYPPWGTVHYYYRLWRLNGLWMEILDALSSMSPLWPKPRYSTPLVFYEKKH